ncbi:MAG: hypothetical protein J7L71_08465, partial [Spirochaetaceae bacterium]|nr:hypothetical protein [Spirochaetaceae bacterium]
MKLQFLILFFFISVISFATETAALEKIFLKVFPENYELYSNKQLYSPSSYNDHVKEYLIPSDSKSFFLRSDSYRDKYLFLNDNDHLENYPNSEWFENPIEIKLERMNSSLVFEDILDTGSQPKSVEFSPNGAYIAVALLNGSGVEIYSPLNMELIASLQPPDRWSEKKGFVETVFFKTRNELWVSQMTTGMIHVFNTKNWDYKLSFDCGGSWPKVITLNKNEDTAYISNWESRNISIVNSLEYSVKKTIFVNGIPRGLAVSPDEKYLYVANYTSGDINKIDLVKNLVIKNIDLGNGALRHVVISEEKNRLYVSDMFHGTITILNLNTDTVIKSFYAGSNINT